MIEIGSFEIFLSFLTAVVLLALKRTWDNRNEINVMMRELSFRKGVAEGSKLEPHEVDELKKMVRKNGPK